MAEQFLHGAEIAAGLQQMAREAVPQHVRMDVHAQAQQARAVPQTTGDPSRAQAAAAAGDEERRLAGPGKLAAHASQAETAAAA